MSSSPPSSVFGVVLLRRPFVSRPCVTPVGIFGHSCLPHSVLRALVTVDGIWSPQVTPWWPHGQRNRLGWRLRSIARGRRPVEFVPEVIVDAEDTYNDGGATSGSIEFDQTCRNSRPRNFYYSKMETLLLYAPKR